jgi:SHS2 domain-containing protein
MTIFRAVRSWYNKASSIRELRSVDKAFEVLDHTADIGIIAYGPDVEHVFANAATGMASLIVDLDEIGDHIERDIELASYDEENLLVEWLNELLYIFDVEHILFKRIEVSNLHNATIKAVCFGDRIDFQRHRVKREIKAATYHMLTLSKEQNVYSAQIIFDI